MPSEQTAEFEDLYRESAGAIFAFVAGMLRDRSAAEEVTAIAFERGFRARATFDRRRGAPRAWMFGIARNAALDELRRRGRVAELPPEPEDRTSAGPPELAEASARREVVLRALDKLEPREQPSPEFLAGLDRRLQPDFASGRADERGTKDKQPWWRMRLWPAFAIGA